MILKSDRPILLINPLYRVNWEYIEDNPAAVVPLGILSIGTVLAKEGYKVKLIDACTNPHYIEDIKNTLKEHPLFIGISVMTAQVHSALKISRLIRQEDRAHKIPIVWGGIHPTIFPESTAKDPSVDIVVKGLGEYACVELAQAFSSESKAGINNIHDIVFSEGDKFISTPLRSFMDINNLPFIDYGLVDLEKFIHRSPGYGAKMKKRHFVIYAGVGCPFRCTFCASPALYNRRYSGKTAQRILEEVDFYTQKYNLEYISFCDDLFFVNKKRIEEFVNGMLKREYKIEWYGNIRADCFRPNFLSEDLISRMKQAGCDTLGMGVESGSQELIDNVIKKDIKLEYVLEAARLCSKYDIRVGYSFMMGLPGETKRDTLNTISLMNKIKRLHSRCFFFGPQVYIPFPGSELYNKAVQLGFSAPKDLEEWAGEEANKSLQSKLSGEYLWSSFDLSKLPWIKHTGLIRYIDFMQNFLFRDLGTIELDFKYPVKIIYFFIARLRVKTNFWSFPVEFWFYRLIGGVAVGKKNKGI